MEERYYLHGDQEESNNTQYYCVLCDLFVEEEHFERDKYHIESSHKRYLQDYKSYLQKHKSYLLNRDIYRPKNPPNLFVDLPNPIISIKSQFYRWLIKQKNRNDLIGDISKEIHEDRKFPVNTDSLKKIKVYLLKKSACAEAVQAMQEAHSEYRGKRKYSEISQPKRFKVFKRDGYRCKICGRSADNDQVTLEVDHKIPVAKGGSAKMCNLWTLCLECNRGKGKESL